MRKKVRKTRMYDNFYKPDYRGLPKDLKEVIKLKPEPIEKERKIVFDGKQFLVRFPTEIVKTINIDKGDKIKFIAKLDPENPNKRELEMEYIHRKVIR